MAPRSKEMNDDPMAKLTDDILAEIISRVPYKSTCCCKCVSTRWRDLISHPDHREKMPQSLAGFFCNDYSIDPLPRIARRFTNVSGKGEPLVDPSLPFLPKYENVEVLDCCNGLLLCRCWTATDPKTLDYVVCNPATEKWVVVPATEWSSKVNVARLGFEPAVSSHFHVFEFVPADVFWKRHEPSAYAVPCFIKVGIYSSKAGVWSEKKVPASTCGLEVPVDSRTVFLRGTLYLSAFYGLVVAVDFEGNNWRFIHTPAYREDTPDGIYLSQGQLYFTHEGDSELSIWVLEGENWTLKQSVSCLQLFGELYSLIGKYYKVISIHPEHNVVFMVSGPDKALISYDMDSRELCFICELGWDCTITSYIPYVPLFSKSLADGH
ncbi:F-box protein At5g07610-like [Lolium rigidum]|uniref:F-box protein At5g07610-like n=1 Tax=Lolium rigidum TaxID=89674 RepID=UPI001F5DA645|nr:F-box protein At5g07610-like [Lolium rigidum]